MLTPYISPFISESVFNVCVFKVCVFNVCLFSCSLRHTHNRYSPDGSKFCSAGSDMKAFVYDTASSAKVGELKGHKGTINGCAWSPDGAKLVTASADKSVMVYIERERERQGVREYA